MTTSARRARRLSVLAIALATMTFACSSDGSGPLSSVEVPGSSPGEVEPPESSPAETTPAETTPPADTTPPETAPPAETAPSETAPAEPTPPAETAPPEETDDESSNSLLVAILIAALVAVGGLIYVLSRRSGGGSAQASPEQARLDAVLQRGRTIHDVTTLSVLQQADPAGLRSVWSICQRELIEVESQAGALASVVDDAAAVGVLGTLVGSASNLRGALEANVNLRLTGDVADQSGVVDASNQTVLSRRAEFDAALQQSTYLGL